MSNTPIFDQLVAEFEARRNMKFQTLLAPTKTPSSVKGVRPAGYIVNEVCIHPDDFDTIMLEPVEDVITVHSVHSVTHVVPLSQRGAA